MAYELTNLVHGEEEAKKALEAAKGIFAGGNAENMPKAEITQDDFTDGKIDAISILVKAGLVSSRSEGRRTIEQGGLTINNEKVTDIAATYEMSEFESDFIVKKGKKNFRKIVLV